MQCLSLKTQKKMKEKKTLEFFLIYYAMPYQHKAYSFTAVLSDETESCLQLSLFHENFHSYLPLGILFHFIKKKKVTLSLAIFSISKLCLSAAAATPTLREFPVKTCQRLGSCWAFKESY